MIRLKNLVKWKFIEKNTHTYTHYEKKNPSSNSVNLAEFVLKKYYFEFDSKVKNQTSGTTIGSKFVAPYTCIFRDKVENEFEAEHRKP